MNRDLPKPIYWDVETEALPLEEIAHLMPNFEAPSNYKDPYKIEAYVEEAKSKWIEKCALSPITGRILCIAYMVGERFEILDGGGDEALLLMHWALACGNPAQKMISFAGASFDIPFCQRRAWKHGVHPMEQWDFDYFRQYRHVDLKVVFEGRKPEKMISLDTAGKFFGMEGKTDDGGNFSKLWREDRKSAIAYAKRDCELTAGIARRMGVTI